MAKSVHKMHECNILIAADLVAGVAPSKIAKKYDLHERTVTRRSRWPEMIEIMDAIRDGRLEANEEQLTKKMKERLAALKAEAAAEAAAAAENPLAQAVKKQCKDEQAQVLQDLDLTPITRELILAILHQLAIMPPERTKGSIEGQQKAADSLWEKMGFQVPKIEEIKPARPNVFRAEWMDDKQQQPN